MTTTKQTNVSTYGADVLHYAGLKGEQDSGPLFFALAHADTLHDLKSKIAYAVSKGDKLRPIILDHWKATPEGETVQKEYAALVATKAKTPDQTVRQQALLELFNQVNIQTQRNVDTLVGIDLLRASDREVNIDRIEGTSKYACYVRSTVKRDDGTAREFIHVTFTATQLRKLEQVKDKLNADLSTAEVRKLCDSLKQGAANSDKGNTDAIDRTKLGSTARALDTAISGTIVSGKLEGVSGTTRDDVYAFWAHLDAELSDAEKAKARAAFKARAAKPDTVPNVVTEAKKQLKRKAK